MVTSTENQFPPFIKQNSPINIISIYKKVFNEIHVIYIIKEVFIQ